MRNATNRHVKTNIKDQIKQNVINLREADCCRLCKHASTGYFTDCVSCVKRDEKDTFDYLICDRFERRSE